MLGFCIFEKVIFLGNQNASILVDDGHPDPVYVPGVPGYVLAYLNVEEGNLRMCLSTGH